jgi:hypothetical protein
MTYRWERELEKLRTLEPRTDLWETVKTEPQHIARAPSLRPRQRIVAGIVAFAVFAAAGAFAWTAFRPEGASRLTANGTTVPPFVLQVLDRASAPPITVTTEASSGQSGAHRPTERSPHVLDITYGSVVGRWDPSSLREHRNARPDLVRREGLTFLYPDSEPALNAGAKVRLSSQAAGARVVLIPVAGQYSSRRMGPSVQLSDGGVLPRPGHYVLEVRVDRAGVAEVWSGSVWIIPPGTFQLLWFNDGEGPHGEPFISMAVNGSHAKGGILDATGVGASGGQPTPYPFPDNISPTGLTLTVVSGSPIAMLAPATRPGNQGNTRIMLSYASPAPPYQQLGAIPVRGPARVMSMPPGDYLFRVYVDFRQADARLGFHGYRVCPIHVIASRAT